MRKLIVLFFSMFVCLGMAQYNVHGVFTDSLPAVKNVALYQFQPTGTKYLKYVQVKDNQFHIAMDSLPPGMYKALYVNKSNGYVDFVYNQENIIFKVNSTIGQSSVIFEQSVENQLLQNYQKEAPTHVKNVLTALFDYIDAKDHNTSNYEQAWHDYQQFNKSYLEKSKGLLVYDYIRAQITYFPEKPYESVGAYLDDFKIHYFDFINFQNSSLQKSSVLKDKVYDFVFAMNRNTNAQQLLQDQKNAVNHVLSLIQSDVYKEIVLEILAHQSVSKEQSSLLQFVADLYKMLPVELHQIDFLKDIKQKAQTMIGATAPNFKIHKTMNMYNVKSPYTLLVFWSSGCAHCGIEVPRLHTFLKNYPAIKVVAVGLENKEEVQNWNEQIKKMPNWIHVLAEGKWDHPIADDYNLRGTPAYFLLDAKKRIVYKPYNDKKLEEYLESNNHSKTSNTSVK